MYNSNPPPQGQVQRVPDPTAELGTIVAKGVYRLATKHYLVSSMWIAGLITLTFFQGFAPSPENLQQYNKLSKSIDHKLYSRLAQDVWVAEEAFRESKGWFTCDHVCQVNKRVFKDAQAKLNKLEKQQEKQQRQANSHLGIFSTYAVEEAKQLFWKSFKWGKKFGTRQTLFDMLFVGVRSMGRNESLIEYIFSVCVQNPPIHPSIRSAIHISVDLDAFPHQHDPGHGLGPGGLYLLAVGLHPVLLARFSHGSHVLWRRGRERRGHGRHLHCLAVRDGRRHGGH